MISFQKHIEQTNLYPFTLLRDTSDLFSGAFTNKERWTAAANCFQLPELHNVPANLIPYFDFWKTCKQYGLNHSLEQSNDYTMIQHKWDYIQQNEKLITSDIQLLKLMNTFQPLPEHLNITGDKSEIYIEEGATIEQATINTTSGPVYISKDALIMDGACLRGPIFIGRSAVVKMGAMIYGGSSIGEKAIVGGEIKNSIISSFSNKAHDGYLGDSIIGEWCNLGAGTTVSNLKNNASDVELWNMHDGIFETAGKKCGTFMGDFSRTGINTSLNTGTVIGICSNIVPVNRLTPKFVPNFTWFHDQMSTYLLDKAFLDIQNWMSFKEKELTPECKNKLISIFNSENL